jgi:uncharacterized protein (TIGR00369 family)
MSAAEELATLLAAQPQPDCAALTPCSVEDADFEMGRVVLLFAPQPAFKNHFDNVQGGFAVAMIDVLISIAAFTKTRLWLPTGEIKSSFVAPMKLGECRGEGLVIRAGKQLVFLEARLWGADGKLAVHATATAAVPAQSGSRPCPQARNMRPLMPNPSLKRSTNGVALGPRGALVHHAPHGPSTTPPAPA